MTDTKPEPADLGDDLDDLGSAIDQINDARKALTDTLDRIAAKKIHRIPTDLLPDWDWDTPESLWLNAFSCIRPTDEFAAEVGRSVISTVMAAHPRVTTIRVRAS